MSGEGEGEEEASLREIALRGDRQLPILVVREKIGESGEAERFGGPAAEAYENRAIPRATIRFKQVKKAIAAAAAIPSARSGLSAPLVAGWQELGPVTPTVPAIATYTDRATQNSGRLTAVAINPNCVPGNCRLWVGAAGGGVWRRAGRAGQSRTGLARVRRPRHQRDRVAGRGPQRRDGNTIYAGTGEPNGSGDSEAGLGLYKCTNGGDTWTLVSGKPAVAMDRSIGSIAIDPTTRTTTTSARTSPGTARPR